MRYSDLQGNAVEILTVLVHIDPPLVLAVVPEHLPGPPQAAAPLLPEESGGRAKRPPRQMETDQLRTEPRHRLEQIPVPWEQNAREVGCQKDGIAVAVPVAVEDGIDIAEDRLGSRNDPQAALQKAEDLGRDVRHPGGKDPLRQ